MRIATKTIGVGAGVVLASSLVTVATNTSASAEPHRQVVHPYSVAAAPGSGRLVVDWNRQLVTILETPGMQPATVHPTRSLALLQAAELDAVASTTRAVSPYLFSVPALPGARPDAATDQAAHDVLVSLYPAARTQVDQTLSRELAAIPDSAGKSAGEGVGALVARILLAVRSFDHSDAAAPSVAAGTEPGQYRPTPPKLADPVFTGWANVTPFVLGSAAQFRPQAPPSVDSPAYARALNEVQSLGQDTSSTRSADQTAAGKFWSSAPIWITWNQIAQQLVLSHHASLNSAAAAFAGLNLSLADTTIALYDAKYHYYVWRPITAIREGGTGYNPSIAGDSTWNSLTPTAPDPSYPGAHSALSEAAATVLTHFFRDGQSLTVTSDAMPGATRSFDSISAIADEAGLSRIYAGQHTRIDHVAGQALGADVAAFVLRHENATAGAE